MLQIARNKLMPVSGICYKPIKELKMMFLNKKVLLVMLCCLMWQPHAIAKKRSFHTHDHPMEVEMRESKTSNTSDKSGKNKSDKKSDDKKDSPDTKSDKNKTKVSPLVQLSRELSRRNKRGSSGRGLGLILGGLAHEMSAYGFRIHPISGKRKLHTGIDFAAPRGTKIYAAGNGVIRVKKFLPGYGKTIIITHDNGVETLYAHMSRFASGTGENKSVRRGELIGYVGSTGSATGPHLHYEIRRGGRPVNPKKNAHLVR